MSAQAAQRRLFPGFAGVALADILANGVAILIMLIVITIMIKHQQEEKRLEQVEDVSVLLSRDLATSVVMNALPTSPPARLHNYKKSPLDRNPTHAQMPVIELHTDFIRNYYTGETISRDELLRHDNALDRYVKKLNRTQLTRMRVDIYDIRLFYITMSIFKDYSHRPNHWHFIGYPEGGDSESDGGWGDGKGEKLFSEKEPPVRKPGEGRGNDVGGSEGARETDDARSGISRGIPQNTTLDERPGGLDNYPYDDLAFQSGGPEKQEAPKDLPGSISEPANEREQTSDDFFNTLAQMMAQGLSNQSGQPQTRLSRFRSARAVKGAQEGMPGEDDGDPQHPLLKISNLRLMLPALFEFMRRIQAEADAGGASRLAEYDFRRDILPLLQQIPQSSGNARISKLLDELGAALSVEPPDTDAPLSVTQKTDRAMYANALAVPVNRRMNAAVLVGNEAQDQRDDLPGEVVPTLHFGLYPAIYRGLRAPLKKDALVLIPPDQNAPHAFRWRVVTVVSPAADDFMTAFVYAALDDDGQLLLASEENALNISDYRVMTNYPTLPFRNERWLLLLYGIPALLIALGVLHRSKKAA